ncbi:MAG TPA: hypothetical protein VFG86_07440 [Chloroflexota bacterium]|nr:hypothetical protein [Chloroflexota bacterium]
MGGQPSAPITFDYAYRIFNTASQQASREFSGTGTGNTVVDVAAREGDEIRLEATPQRTNEFVMMRIEAAGAELGKISGSGVVGTPSILRVFCCSR